jgi:PIN domain nuclease of toxin-antitoxin system
VRALLDTHTFLWWITNSKRLSSNVRAIITDGTNELFLSAATGWEIATKSRLGRLDMPADPVRFVGEQLALNVVQPLPIELQHALHVFTLPDYHRDPFDRILIAQSQLENLTILTADSAISQYDVDVIW